MVCSAAAEILNMAHRRAPRTEHKMLRAVRLSIAHDRALRRRDVNTAFEISAQLTALASPPDTTDIHLR